MLLMVSLFVGLTSCDNSKIYDENFSVTDNIWNSEDIKTFSMEITDTLSPLNIYVNLRTTVDYPYSNIYVFLYSEFPNGSTNKDTLEFLLAESDGKWLGENTGTIVEFKGLISTNSRFSTEGTYIFKIQHAMREENLAEIVDIGMRVERMKTE